MESTAAIYKLLITNKLKKNTPIIQDLPKQKNTFDCGIFSLKVSTRVSKVTNSTHKLNNNVGSTVYHHPLSATIYSGKLLGIVQYLQGIV